MQTVCMLWFRNVDLVNCEDLQVFISLGHLGVLSAALSSPTEAETSRLGFGKDQGFRLKLRNVGYSTLACEESERGNYSLDTFGTRTDVFIARLQHRL